MFANVVSAKVTKVAVSDARKYIKGQIKEKTERRAKLKKVRIDSTASDSTASEY